MPQTIEWQGKPVSYPGVYSKMPMDFYHSAKACIERAVSSSGLRSAFSDGPSSYWDSSPYNPKGEPKESTPAMTRGRAAHHLLLGETQFRKVFAIRPEMFTSYTSGEAKAWRKTVESKGFTAITPTDLECIKGMAQAIFDDPFLRETGLLNGEIERSLFYKEPKTGLWLKGRPDAMPKGGDYSDLKVTTDVSFDALQKKIGEFRYDMQGALVHKIARELQLPFSSFSFVFVTDKRPFDVQTVTLKDDDLAHAEADLDVTIKLIARCFETGRWPGPNLTQKDAAPIGLNDWSRKRAVERRAYIKAELGGA